MAQRWTFETRAEFLICTVHTTTSEQRTQIMKVTKRSARRHVQLIPGEIDAHRSALRASRNVTPHPCKCIHIEPRRERALVPVYIFVNDTITSSIGLSISPTIARIYYTYILSPSLSLSPILSLSLSFFTPF